MNGVKLMERERLLIEKPTAQVRILVEEFLSDGKVHSRKEIVAYLQQQAKLLELPVFREGHIAGGIREATTNLNCEKVGRAIFQLKISRDEEEESCGQRAADICKTAMEQLIVISREIDYVNANEQEITLLTKVRECVQQLKRFQGEFAQHGNE